MIQSLHRLAGRLLGRSRPFRSADYWQNRYSGGGTSGAGSYGRLADWKAEILNAFVAENNIQRVLEIGCGDGNQLTLANYPEYCGFDVAPKALDLCRERFSERPWRFHLYSHNAVKKIGTKFNPELVMSLDVIFHLVEDAVFDDYMRSLFALEPRFVAVYASNGSFIVDAPHVRNWVFTDWIEANAPGWKLTKKIDNAYPFDPSDPDNTSFSDFYIFEKHEA